MVAEGRQSVGHPSGTSIRQVRHAAATKPVFGGSPKRSFPEPYLTHSSSFHVLFLLPHIAPEY